MHDSRHIERPPAELSAILAAIHVIIVMALLYWRFSGDAVPDWDGYGRLYDHEGGWLLRTGREPGFIWFLGQARAIFGIDGYDKFRLALYCGFTAFAAWLALRAPYQVWWHPLGYLVVTTIVVLAFLLKGLVQIREGLAFAFIVAPLAALYGGHKGRLIQLGIGSVVAAIIHAATLIFSAAWIVAVFVRLAPEKILGSRRLQHGLLFAALCVGGVLAITLLRNIDAVKFLLQDFGVDRHAEAFGALGKYLYWAGNGILAFFVRGQLIAEPRTTPKFAFAYATAIGSVLLPMTYSVCLVLVLTNFEMGAVVSMAIRLFFTTSELAMVIILMRGRTNFITLCIALAMIVDRVRLMVTV